MHLEPSIRDGNIYARGACDDKGQMYMHIKAVEALRQCRGGKLPVNVKFLIEGEGWRGIDFRVPRHGPRAVFVRSRCRERPGEIWKKRDSGSPTGGGGEDTSIIDLIRMRCWSYTAGGDGKGKEGDIPEALKEAASAGHEALVEMVAEGNDELLEEFFATGTLPCDHLISGLQQAVRDRRIFPALCCSAAQNAGADLLMSFLAEVFPSPLARNGLPAVQNGKEIEKSITPNEPPCSSALIVPPQAVFAWL